MAFLTKEQESFLRSQSISSSMLFDASGLSQAEREKRMSELKKYFFYGGAPCKKGGHTLRTKKGHCIQCDTSKIAYQLRSSAKGYVYLAYSQQTKLIKVGFSESDPDARELNINKEAYGNISDWEIHTRIKLEKDAGRREFEIHALLARYLKPISYIKNINAPAVECREIFECELSHAKKIFDSVVHQKT